MDAQGLLDSGTGLYLGHKNHMLSELIEIVAPHFYRGIEI